MGENGGQLFTYFKFSNQADYLALYASKFDNGSVEYHNEIVKIEDDYREGSSKDFYDKWNKLTKENGIFGDDIEPYHFENRALTPDDLKPIAESDSGVIFNQFLEILRRHVVSDKPNAFNKIFTLFLCKVYDEKTTKDGDELEFQWKEGKDDHVAFQLRLSDLYRKGMRKFLDKEITDFSEEDFNSRYKKLDSKIRNKLLKEFSRIRLEKNNEFAIKEVFDNGSFLENAAIVKDVVELLQGFRIRYNKKQQYLSDFFELLLHTGLKQETGQFFTPVPITQFIIKSIPIDRLVNEKLQSDDNQLLPYVMDFAAGSGHFLTETLHEIQRILNEVDPGKYNPDTSKKIEMWQLNHFNWATEYIYGVEKDYRLVKVGKVGCYLHGDGLANVILGDGLCRFGQDKYKGVLGHRDSSKENRQFDIVVSNPPYSVSSFKQAARKNYTEDDFDLYNDLTDKSSEIECLFVERTSQLLKTGGMVGIILPSSILDNSNVIYTRTREIILRNFHIIAIAELGSNTFMETGTNTVTMFLKRRDNNDSLDLNLDGCDTSLNGIEKPLSKYIEHVWHGLSLKDYRTLLQGNPNETVMQHKMYQKYTDMELEREKFRYFVLAYPQKVVLVRTGKKEQEKEFLGYHFKKRRGYEGIHSMVDGKPIEQCTRLFDHEVSDNPAKASTYIYKAFDGDTDTPIDESLFDNVSRLNLVDILTFDREKFDKTVSLNVKKQVDWGNVPTKSLKELCHIRKGSTITKAKTTPGSIPVIAGGKSPAYFHNKFNRTGDTITVSATGANAGFISYFEEPIFASDCITLETRDNNVIPTKLICYYMRKIQGVIYGLQKGQAQPHVYARDLEEIQIPLPSLEEQERLSQELKE